MSIIMKDKIKEILRENIELSEVNIELDEAEGSSVDVSPGQYERLRNLLSNDIFNHAGIMQKLWGSKDATKRSLFRKKLNQMKNDEGGTYEFSKEEVAKIISILMDTSSDIKTKLTPKKTQ